MRTARTPRQADGEGFAADASAADAPQPAAPSSSASRATAVDSVSALMALQGAGGGPSRAEAYERAEASLDDLDAMRLALLEGRDASWAAQRLAQRLREDRTQTDDEGLESLAQAVELRAAVELAKRGLA